MFAAAKYFKIFQVGLYNVSYFVIFKSVGEEYQAVKRGKAFYGCEKKYNMEKGKWNNFIFPVIFRLFGKNIRGERGRIKIKNWGGEEYQVAGNFIQVLNTLGLASKLHFKMTMMSMDETSDLMGQVLNGYLIF